MTNTNPTTDTTAIRMPTGDEIYDALMSDIDMDLITVNLPRLAEKYKDESDANRAVRLERYKAAYEKYDIAFAKWISELDAAVAKSRREALRSAEAKERAQDIATMSALEEAFATAV